MSTIECKNLTKSFGALDALRDISTVFPENQTTCLLGPSGCGKTTLLRILAGLDSPTTGEIYFDGIATSNKPPEQRDIGMVFQNPVVYPGLTVRQNLELPLKRSRRAQGVSIVNELLDFMGLESLSEEPITSLSNAVRQKVVVARALVRQPEILLFDEPLTNVSPEDRMMMKWIFDRIHTTFHPTLIYVTHDQTEAMTLADKIVVMEKGVISQEGSPKEVYEAPQNRFVAWFLGNPGMNFVDNVVVSSHQGDDTTITHPIIGSRVFSDVDSQLVISAVGFRPEHVEVSKIERQDATNARVVRSTLTIGGQQLLTLENNSVRFMAKVYSVEMFEPGESVWVYVNSSNISLFEPSGNYVHHSLKLPAVMP